MPTISPSAALLPILLNPGEADELDLNDGVGYVVHADLSLEPPQARPVYVSSHETEGSIPVSEAHYDNREIGMKVRVYGDTDAEVEDRLAELAARIASIHRRGGTIGITTPGGRILYFELVNEGSANPEYGATWLKLNKTDVEIRLQARPFWRGEEIHKGSFTESTLPALIATVPDVEGDVPALGRLVVTDLSGNDQWHVDAAVQSAHLDLAPTAALFYEAEDLTPVGASAIVAGAAGASGTDVVRNTALTASWQVILASQYTPTGHALSHIGSFRVKARVYRPTGNTGAVSLRMKWGAGDFRRRTRNPATTYPVDTLEGGFTWVDLGVVHLPEMTMGLQEWRFEIEAKSTVVGDEMDLDCFLLYPTTEGYIELSAVDQIDDPATKSAGTGADDASVGLVAWTNPGVITAEDATYATAATTAFQTTHYLRATNFGFALPSTALVRGIKVEIRKVSSAGGVLQENAVNIVKGGTIQAANRANPSLWSVAPAYTSYGGPTDLWGTTWLFSDINAATFGVVLAVSNLSGSLSATAHVDHVRITVYYTEVADAAIFASQSLELRHDRAVRQNSTGLVWTDVSRRYGKYLRLPPGDDARLIVKGYRRNPNTGIDPAIDPIVASLYVTPRGLTVPGG